MNNQAAQTMPELPEPSMTAFTKADGMTPFWHYDGVPLVREGRRSDSDKNRAIYLYTADQMHQYARDYALSQTAGVADGYALVPIEPTRAMVNAGWTSCERMGDTYVVRDLTAAYRAMLAAAPAASGAHPDALPDGTLSKSTAKRVEALASASVSERARELLAAECENSGFRDQAEDLRAGLILGGLPGVALRALEQALTQQRGDGEAVDRDAWAEALELPQGYTVEEFLPGGWHYAWTRADGERMVSGTTWNHPALAAIAAWQYAPATTPQPSAEGLRELVQRWRGAGTVLIDSQRVAYESCADELESLLGRGAE